MLGMSNAEHAARVQPPIDHLGPEVSVLPPVGIGIWMLIGCFVLMTLVASRRIHSAWPRLHKLLLWATATFVVALLVLAVAGMAERAMHEPDSEALSEYQSQFDQRYGIGLGLDEVKELGLPVFKPTAPGIVGTAIVVVDAPGKYVRLGWDGNGYVLLERSGSNWAELNGRGGFATGASTPENSPAFGIALAVAALIAVLGLAFILFARVGYRALRVLVRAISLAMLVGAFLFPVWLVVTLGALSFGNGTGGIFSGVTDILRWLSEPAGTAWTSLVAYSSSHPRTSAAVLSTVVASVGVVGALVGSAVSAARARQTSREASYRDLVGCFARLPYVADERAGTSFLAEMSELVAKYKSQSRGEVHQRFASGLMSRAQQHIHTIGQGHLEHMACDLGGLSISTLDDVDNRDLITSATHLSESRRLRRERAIEVALSQMIESGVDPWYTYGEQLRQRE